MNMATTNIEIQQEKERDLALAFLILTLAFFAIVLLKTGINNQYLNEVVRLKTNINSIMIKP
jgi:hypothetical protein